MDLNLKNKNALICASSKGLGFSVAEALAAEGANIIINSRSDENLAIAKKKLMKITNENKITCLCADLSKLDGVKLVLELINTKFQRLDILVNNSGGPKTGNFDNLDLIDFDEAIENNLKNFIYLTNEIIPMMKKNNWGRIVNICSSSLKQPIDNLMLSNITRAGLAGYVKTISNQYAVNNIMVNNVLPGRIITDRIKEIASKNLKDGESIQDRIDSMGKDIPIKRLGSPSEFGPMVAFLCSDKASYITGNSIQIDGGLIKGLF